MSTEPRELPPTPENFRALRTATERLLTTCELLTDADVAAPTALPGWTRGHVLNHLARQAPALERLLDWARTGVEHPQYTSRRARDTEIEQAADRPAAELTADIARTAESLQTSITRLPEAAWNARIRPFTGEDCTPRRVLVIRLRELEVHHADLATGYTLSDTPADVLQVLLDDVLGHLRASESMPSFELRDPHGALIAAFGDGDGPTVTGTPADALGWLTGRSRGEGLSAPHGLPALPDWI